MNGSLGAAIKSHQYPDKLNLVIAGDLEVP
jgi:hypothetical protein